uniref:Uncharacterized protein n=1 Tax=Leersia perrieri TaxID=77586 RepID=A0A0D9X7K7_9ORYZ
MSTRSSSMNPLLLASACSGSRQALSFLLTRQEDAPHLVVPTQEFLNLLLQGNSSSSSSTLPAAVASLDVEEGGADHTTAPLATPLLDGVTVDGGTALHVVATCGDDDNFLTSADVLATKGNIILVSQDNNGDTPLHCAARAGRHRMVARLIALAAKECCNLGVKEAVLRMENKRRETALHEAVRLGSKRMVELLMAADPELARFPEQGTSPLYLAITLQRAEIAESLERIPCFHY